MTDLDTRAQVAHVLHQASTDPENRDLTLRQYALEAAVRVSEIPAVRAGRIDFAELIGFIHNWCSDNPGHDHNGLATAIVEQFSMRKHVP